MASTEKVETVPPESRSSRLTRVPAPPPAPLARMLLTAARLTPGTGMWAASRYRISKPNVISSRLRMSPAVHK